MADSTQCVEHIELFVDSSSSPAQQAASVDAIANFVKNDTLTLESLVREMEMYLTTTDNIIRARGILLLAEVLTGLASKPLDNVTISSLVGFFTERLADWKALRGALVGCLALVRRKGNYGTVTNSGARAIAESSLQTLSVQALGQHDRKLCFELLGCLLERYSDAVMALDDLLVYGVCEAIDGEKDPECLILTFHIVEVLAGLFPDTAGPLTSFAEGLFEILGSYFPIHFTHSEGEDFDARREELSRSLMLAFASIPLFEQWAIPLFLEKLSSSLPTAKVESLKYLSYCTVKYGAERMAKHVGALWSSLKDVIFTSAFALDAESRNSMEFQVNEIATEAFLLLQKVILQDDGSFLSLILGDDDIKTVMNSLASFKDYDDIPIQSKERLHAVGCILSASAKASRASCNRVFERFFPSLMDALGVSVQISSGDSRRDEEHAISSKLNFGAFYVSVNLLAACRELVVGFDEASPIATFANETWCLMLHSFSSSLTRLFNRTLVTPMHENTWVAYVPSAVKGLQILATFPGSFLVVPKSVFEDVLMQLISIITLGFDKIFLWKMVLKALVDIGLFLDKCRDFEMMKSFNIIVVERIVSLMSSDDFTMPSPLKVEAISDIGQTSPTYMLRIVQEFEKTISANLCGLYVHGNLKSAEITVQLLEWYSYKLLPRFQSVGGFEEVPLRFSVCIWDQIENSSYSSNKFQEKKLLSAMMMAMKHAVGNCLADGQSIIVDKALSIVLSSTSFPMKDSIYSIPLVGLKELQLTLDLDSFFSRDEWVFSSRDEWVVSLFASVIIALRPETPISNIKVVVQLFMATLLNGHVPSAQALGSLVNKLPSNGTDASKDFSLEEATNLIFSSGVCSSCSNGHLTKISHTNDGTETSVTHLRGDCIKTRALQIHAVVGLAWIGKGLLMRGHEKVKDVIMTFLNCLLPGGNVGALPSKQDPSKDTEDQEVLRLMKSAADAFQILISDSEACLNRRFHATTRPLYKQRFFNIVMPMLLSSIVKSDASNTRSMLYRASAHVMINTPLSAIVSEARKLIPVLLDCLSMLSEDVLDKDILYSGLLVLSGILTDINGQEAVVDNAHIIIKWLIELVSYPHMMLIRETAIECLVAMSELPHARIYPTRTQVLLAISKALGDRKRVVRQEAVRCRQAWASIASRSLKF